MSFEGWVYHTHIADLTSLARAFPDTPIIFNHLGGPIGVGSYAGHRDEVFAAWKPAVTELAKCPNVFAKVGGIQMVVNGFGWEQRQRPPTSDELLDANAKWYRHTIEQFGPSRCMITVWTMSSVSSAPRAAGGSLPCAHRLSAGRQR